MDIEFRIHKSMTVHVLSYEAQAAQAAITAMTDEGAPANAALKVEQVGSWENPRTLVKLEWSDVVTTEVTWTE